MNLSNPAVLNGLDMCDRTKILPVAAVCAGQTIWGFSYIFTKVAMGYAKPDFFNNEYYVPHRKI